jgi:hypothetical protein
MHFTHVFPQRKRKRDEFTKLFNLKIYTYPQTDNMCEANENLRESCDASATVGDCESVFQ